MRCREIKDLVNAEQKRQKNNFIKTDNIDRYLLKIQKYAEIITHYKSGQCAGFIAFYCNDKNKKIAFITLFLIDPQFRGEGVANSLMSYTLFFCKTRGFEKCKLKVRKDNHVAIKFYENFGFKLERYIDENLLMSIML